MKIDDLITESNDWGMVKKLLDKLFGLTTNLPSRLKRVKQGFDQQTGEHVIHLEYRAKAPYQQAIPKKQKVKLRPETDKRNK